MNTLMFDISLIYNYQYLKCLLGFADLDAISLLIHTYKDLKHVNMRQFIILSGCIEFLTNIIYYKILFLNNIFFRPGTWPI